MYRLHEDVEVQGVYNELMDKTAEEARNEMISRIRMMTSGGEGGVCCRAIRDGSYRQEIRP